ncbi:DUF2812 domain-containing protein [Erysipelotrichaceae bacterium OH741_COT-311]|nr:DUF2812 domain-containing protein [Erysipelotrichaceae bacterium OH741_COT-311]
MKKIKIFLDPINDLEVWLNRMAKKGYRLKSVNNFLYDFETSDKDYVYSIQFIGASSSKEINGYIQMLKENGTRVYRSPLNQGNITFGKFRLRPYAQGNGKIANTFQTYNKEILVVEHEGKKPQKLLTNKSDLAKYYKNIRNAYLQGFIGVLALFLYSLYKLYESNFEFYKLIQSGVLVFVTIFILNIMYKAHKNYEKYKQDSELMD